MSTNQWKKAIQAKNRMDALFQTYNYRSICQKQRNMSKISLREVNQEKILDGIVMWDIGQFIYFQEQRKLHNISTNR
jgi:hypothetical protein